MTTTKATPMTKTQWLLHRRAVVMAGNAQWFLELREIRFADRVTYEVVQGTENFEHAERMGKSAGFSGRQYNTVDIAEAADDFDSLFLRWAKKRPDAMVIDVDITTPETDSPVDGRRCRLASVTDWRERLAGALSHQGSAQLFV